MDFEDSPLRSRDEGVVEKSNSIHIILMAIKASLEESLKFFSMELLGYVHLWFCNV